jgi:tRNA uridine 5-carboxymethylaminomethyl modification enzyme
MKGVRMKFDVIVVGGGHAGIEAATAASRLGASVALTLPNPDKIGLMPCNPAVGGPGKSQLVYEVHALGGAMGILADRTAIHARTLNASKGPAVQSLRVQNERDGYAAVAREWIEQLDGVDIVQGEVATIERRDGRVSGVGLVDGRTLEAPSVVLCTGTFLAGVVWYGQQSRDAGRQGEAPARHLSASLRDSGHTLVRFKTGTPPRIRSNTVDFSVLDVVPADDPPKSFSGEPGPRAGDMPTWLTHTTPKTHRLIEDNLDRSAMYGGQIEGQGPRYCPSIEDKVVRFADKDRHLLFVEPDGVETSEVYLQGFSSSMPPVLQDDMIRTLPGFGRADIQRYAYAVEYDALEPTQLTVELMSKRLKGLFSAGQINGTSGYEEAAAQGLLAGVNAARYAAQMPLVTIPRDQGYLGTLIDDLVRWGIDEPYRMLTSRNPYRLLHRQDNANARMLPTGVAWGLVSPEMGSALERSEERIAAEVNRLDRVRIGGDPASKHLRRPTVGYETIVQQIGAASDELSPAERQRVEILVKYSAYIDRSLAHLASRKDHERTPLDEIVYDRVSGLSNEGKHALETVRPATLGAAQRLRGVRDSDATALLVHLKRTGVARVSDRADVSRETSARS